MATVLAVREVGSPICASQVSDSIISCHFQEFLKAVTARHGRTTLKKLVFARNSSKKSTSKQNNLKMCMPYAFLWTLAHN